MKALRIAITHTEATIHPIHSLVCTTPDISRELILYFRISDGFETTINYIEGDPDAYEWALETELDVDDYDVYPDGNGGCYSYLRNELDTHSWKLVTAFERETVAVIPPIEFLPDRRMLVSVVIGPSEFQQIRDEIPDELTMEVVSVGTVPQVADSHLTAKQRRAIRTAWDLGYYDIPRSATLEDIAARLECSVSTVSDLLRRGQASLVAAELGENRRSP